MARYTCSRCGAEYHVVGGTLPDGSTEHVCKDIAARLKRREAQVKAVEDILYDPQGVRGLTLREKAEAIVAKLAGMGVTND